MCLLKDQITLHIRSFLFLYLAILSSCAAMIQSDFVEPVKKPQAFTVKEGVQIWETTSDFPLDKVNYIDSMLYVDGRTYKDLENQAISYARNIRAHGIHIVDIRRSKSSVKIDVGNKRPDLIVHDFDLEDHGVGPDTLHFSKNVYSTAISFSIRVKFFVYR